LEIDVSFIPEEKGVESIARQIKLTGRAYPIFDIARLALRKPERYHVAFSSRKRPDGQAAQSLWTCNLDDTLWLSESEAVDHVLRRHFDTFYRSEKVAAEAPKGTYTFVAQCGLSGEILGPPNLNEVQVKMRKLHADRYSRMPFEVYKARVRILKDEAAVKKWIEEQSWKTEYHCLNIPEPKQLSSRDEVEKHFREVHQANIVRSVESHTLNGKDAQQLPSLPLRAWLRRVWDEQSRFPIRLVTLLSQQFASHGLQFFKVNKTVTHVAVARPHFLDMQVTPVSNSISRIVEFINATPQCTRKKLLDALVPAPTAPAASVVPAAGSDPGAPGVEAAPATPSGAQAVPVAAPSPTPEQTAVIADLHWLIHQGHVLEFANGRMETAKRPLPRPAPKPVPPAAKPGQDPVSTSKVSESASAAAVGDVPAARAVEESDVPVLSVESADPTPAPSESQESGMTISSPESGETQPAGTSGERA